MSGNQFTFSPDSGTRVDPELRLWNPQEVDQQIQYQSFNPTNGYRLRMPASFDTREGLKVRDLLSQFCNQIGQVPLFEKATYHLREIDRDPGYVIDLLIVLSERNRESEYNLYDAIGRLMREHNEMLFDFSIVRRKGRPLNQLVPHGFTECDIHPR
jgi:hypothetical protein